MTKKAYFEQMTRQGLINSKSFWNIVKSFSPNKGFFTSKNIYNHRKQRKNHL